MSLPGEIKIGSLIFDVTTVENLADEEGKPLDGRVTYRDATIRLRTDMVPMYERSVLMHEIVHVLMVEAGLTPTEEQVEAVTNCFGALLLDNPDFTELWLDVRPS